MVHMSKNHKIIVIGLDGGTFNVIKPFVEEGLLPNIASLMKNGSYGILESTIPPVTAPAWVSFMTGKNPGKHGIFHFFKFEKDEYQTEYNFRDRELINFDHVVEPTLYEIIGDQRKIISINMPVTYPPRPINGLLISDWLTPPTSKNYTYPPDLIHELEDYRIDQHFGEKIFALTPEGKVLNSEFLFNDLIDLLEKRARTALKLMHDNQWDIFLICFTETDRVHHYFWRAINPEYPGFHTEPIAWERETFKHFYQKLDSVIGQFLDSAGPDIGIIIMSDHGFGPPPRYRLHVNTCLRHNGFIMVKEPPDAISLKKRLYTLIPTPLRRILGNLLEETHSKQPIDMVDWSKTKAWSVCLNNNIGGIFLNLQGKLASGIIPPSEYDRTVGDISDLLNGFVHPETGKTIVKKIYKREELYQGPHVEAFPSLIYVLDRDFEAGVEGAFDILFPDIFTMNPYPNGRGNHEREGIYIVHGPSFKNIPEDRAFPIESILPTMLYLLDCPIPNDLDGQVMVELIKQSDLASHPIAYCEPIHGRRKEAALDGSNKQDSIAVKEKLRELGYM